MAGSAGGPPAVWRKDYHRGWHSRRYLPHFDAARVTQMITYRLADSLPLDVMHESKLLKDATARRQRLEAALDAGHGACLLRRPENATAVVENWKRFHESRYRLIAWVVRPNHVHVLIDIHPGHPLSRVVHSWKSYTAKIIARRAADNSARCGKRTIGIAPSGAMPILRTRSST